MESSCGMPSTVAQVHYLRPKAMKTIDLGPYFFSEKQDLSRNFFDIYRISPTEHFHFPELMVCYRHYPNVAKRWN